MIQLGYEINRLKGDKRYWPSECSATLCYERAQHLVRTSPWVARGTRGKGEPSEGGLRANKESQGQEMDAARERH